MTVVTTVAPGEPAVLVQRDAATAARTWSPSITSPVASANSARSASPSCATPASAPAPNDLAGDDVGVQGAAARR